MDREEIISELNRMDFLSNYKAFTEEDLERKSQLLSKLAKDMIYSFINEYISPEEAKKAQELLDQIPIELLTEMPKETNEFGKKDNICAYATRDGIVYLTKGSVSSCNSKDPYSMNAFLSTLIHEYCHALRRKQNKEIKGYFEEGFADFFAEICTNYMKLKTNQGNTLFEMNSVRYYTRASRQLKSIMFCLKEQGKEMEAIDEFLLGDDNKFLEICTDVFGREFVDYFNQVKSMDLNVNYSQEVLVNMFSKLVEEKKVDLNNLPKDLTQLSKDSLYFVSNYLLVKSKEKNEQLSKDDNEEIDEIEEYESEYDNDRDNRIRRHIENKYSLEGKNEEEIYETILYLASDYIQKKGLTDEENIIFIKELKDQIPFVEDFAELYRELRVERKDKEILDNLELEDISYEKIYSKMQSMKPKEELSPEEQKQKDLASMLQSNNESIKTNNKNIK